MLNLKKLIILSFKIIIKKYFIVILKYINISYINNNNLNNYIYTEFLNLTKKIELIKMIE